MTNTIIYQIYYTIIWLSGIGQGRADKKGKFTVADQSKLVVYTDISIEEDVDVNIDEPIDLAINSFSVFKIEF